MTLEDIIRRAEDAGFEFFNSNDPEFYGREYCEAWIEEQHAFAELIAAAERNKIAQWMIDRSYATGHGDTVEDLLNELESQVIQEEREICAQLCEAKIVSEYATGKVDQIAWTQACALAIRARGNK